MIARGLIGKGSLARSEAKWQKHVMAALWVAFALLIVIGAGFVYAKAHGLFQSSPEDKQAPVPTAWP
jgi:hypothetical protein